jgi:hypothetical protein
MENLFKGAQFGIPHEIINISYKKGQNAITQLIGQL